jgi:hypothetical protein
MAAGSIPPERNRWLWQQKSSTRAEKNAVPQRGNKTSQTWLYTTGKVNRIFSSHFLVIFKESS